MVAPIQATIGKSSADSATQDYLTELNNFYAKPENEGVKSEFVAPDGSKYDITDASYLSRVSSNVNTGKLDAPAVKEEDKAVSPNADLSLEDDKEKAITDKADKKNDTKTKAPKVTGEDADIAKMFGIEVNNKKANTNVDEVIADKKEEAKANSEKAVDKADNAEGEADSVGKQAETASKGQGTQQGVSTKPEEIDETGSAAVKKGNESSKEFKKQAKEDQKKLVDSNAKAIQEKAALDAKTKQTNTTYKSSIIKLDNAIAAKKARIESEKAEAPEEMEEDAETQSGSTMGFEGKLMTTAGGVTGGQSSTDEAWEQTMQGPKEQSLKNFEKQQATLASAQEAGDKAAAEFNKQAQETDAQAVEQDDAATTSNLTAAGEFTVAGVTTIIAVKDDVEGCTEVPTGTATVTASTPPSVPPPTAPTGLAGIASGVVTLVKGVFSFLASIGGYLSAAATAISGISSLSAANDAEDKAEELSATADEQRADGTVARREAVAQTNKTNAQTLKATQQVNSMAASLGNSELPSITVENQEQFEVVKKDRYDQIMAHEQCHAAVIGGSPVIITDSNGVAIAGYVAIDIPTIDEGNLEGSIEQAQRVIDAALAPSDPSSQDRNIASQAQSVLEKAQSLLEEKANKAKEAEESKEKGEEPKVEEPQVEEKIDTDKLKK